MELYAQAESFGRPVRELLTGQAGPLTHMEWYLWGRYRWAQARLRQQNKAGR